MDANEQSAGSEDEMDWEEVDVGAVAAETSAELPVEVPAKEQAGPSTRPIEVTLKRNKMPPEPAKKKGVNTAAERAARLEAHKFHTIALLANASVRNRWLNDPLLQARIMSLVPLHLQTTLSSISKRNQPDAILRGRQFENGIMRLTTWWHDHFRVEPGVGLRSRTWHTVQAQVMAMAADTKGKSRARDFEGEGEEIRSTKSLMKHLLMMRGSRDVSAQLFTAVLRAVGVPARLVVSVQSVPWQSLKNEPTARPRKRKKRAKAAPPLDDVDSDDDAEDDISSDGDSNIPVNGSADGALSEKPVFWSEVFSRPDQRWLPVDPVRNLVNAKKKFEPDSADRLNRMVYVVAFEEDGHARDVTARYTQHFGARVLKARAPMRSAVDWWEVVLGFLTRPYRLHRDDVEDAELQTNQISESMPNSVGGFKNHPLYALERHLRREEVIHPRTELGKFRGEPVFSRRSVVSLKTPENWMRMGRKVKEGEQALKSVKQRAVTLEKRRAQEMAEMEGDEITQGLYAEWQTELYIPEPVVNGRIPKNNFGNIDLYVPSMLPSGGVHLPYKGIAKVAKKLGFDYAEAVVGFEFRKRRAVPILEGIVVASENEEALLEAYWQTAQAQEEQDRIKRHDAAVKHWVRLIQGLRIRQRLQHQYASSISAAKGDAGEEHDGEVVEVQEAGGFLTSIGEILQPYQLPKMDRSVLKAMAEGRGDIQSEPGSTEDDLIDVIDETTGANGWPTEEMMTQDEDVNSYQDYPLRTTQSLRTVAEMAAEQIAESSTAAVHPKASVPEGSRSNARPVRAARAKRRRSPDEDFEVEATNAVRTRSTGKKKPPDVPPPSRALRPRKQKTAAELQAEEEREEAIRRAADEGLDE